jgi:hypothetical protein
MVRPRDKAAQPEPDEKGQGFEQVFGDGVAGAGVNRYISPYFPGP